MRKPRQKARPRYAPPAVPSRRRDDCMIAALASAQEWTYERTAEALGYPCDPNTGLPNLPLNVGFSMGQVIAPLLSAGTSAAYVLSREHPQMRSAQEPIVMQARLSAMPSDRIKRLIEGRRAVLLGAWQAGAELAPGAKGHFLAWNGSQIVGDQAPSDLSEVTIYEALILSPGQPVEKAPKRLPVQGTSLPKIFDRHERVFLAFSGGKESVVLAHMCEPWREKVTLLWVRIQFHAPHMADFIRGYAERGWRLEEIPGPDLMEHWRSAGTPAEVVPVDHALGRRQPRLQSWPMCCYSIRQVPLNAYIRAQNEPCALLHGQRTADGGATVGGLTGQMPDYVEVAQPLSSWSEAEVMAYIDRHGLTLPEQYGQGCSDSLECLVCPAAPKPERLAYLDRRYPIPARIARRAMVEGGTAAALVVTEMYATAGLFAAPSPDTTGALA